MDRKLLFIGAFGALAFITACAGRRAPSTLPVVDDVDLERYSGIWYEIARYPNRFQRGCVGSKATYTLRPDGRLSVVNECFDGSREGELRRTEGTAWVADPATNAKLKVRFRWPFTGDYWIIGLGETYDYAVVSDPNRRFLWILSRTPEMPEPKYHMILDKLYLMGFDLGRLVRTPQK